MDKRLTGILSSIAFILTFLLFILGIIVLLFNLFTFSVVVSGDSMNPTIHNNDRGFAFNLTPITKIERGDIVILDITTEYHLVKRVVAIPHDTVECKDGTFYINGEIEDTTQYSIIPTTSCTLDLITLGDDEYFVLGDNRDNSLDSRVFGVITFSQIKGKGLYIMRGGDNPLH